MPVPFFRPDIQGEEIAEVTDVLRSGWLTSGPRVKQFASEFATSVRARHALAVNSGTAALHLSVEALALKANQGVLIPTMTFAATAEVVRYRGGVPVLVDCEQDSLNMDLVDGEAKWAQLAAGGLPSQLEKAEQIVGIIPVHVGGLMMNVTATREFAADQGLWIVEDAAHAFPAAFREDATHPWRRCGEGTAQVTCFSFYANKTITTGEGGMAVTDDDALAERMQLMSLHGLSRDAWKRYQEGGSWDYRIIAPGFKYNFTDIAAAIGIHQLRRAEQMREERERLAMAYMAALSDVEEVELPPVPENRIHAWHLFPIKLHLDKLRIDRNQFIEELQARGIGCSVHWRPLHLHPYYEETFGWKPEHFPVATRVWKRLISLPLFPTMTEEELSHVSTAVRELCERHAK